MIVYLARHRGSGKSYVGLTRFSLEKRKREHCQPRHRSVFSSAIAKYGEDAFDWSVLEECTSDKALAERERFWIARLQTIHPNGYNFTSGGDGACDRPLVVRQKISAGHLGKPLSPEHRLASSKGWFSGKSWNQGITLSADIRFRMSEAHKGKRHSEETRSKMRESQQRRWAAL